MLQGVTPTFAFDYVVKLSVTKCVEDYHKTLYMIKIEVSFANVEMAKRMKTMFSEQ